GVTARRGVVRGGGRARGRRSDHVVGSLSAVALARLTDQLFETQLTDGELEALVDRALHEPRDLILRLASVAVCARAEHLDDLRDGDLVGRLGEAIAATRSPFPHDEPGFPKLADDFFEISRGNCLLLGDDMR